MILKKINDLGMEEIRQVRISKRSQRHKNKSQYLCRIVRIGVSEDGS